MGEPGGDMAELPELELDESERARFRSPLLLASPSIAERRRLGGQWQPRVCWEVGGGSPPPQWKSQRSGN